MKDKTILGLCLSAGLLLTGPTALADNDDGKSNSRSARAVQVHIDKDTGRKTAPDDSNLAVQAATVVVPDGASKIMPAENSDVQYNSDGSMSAQLGIENLQYLVMTIDEDGERTVSHQSIEDIESNSITTKTDKGEN